MWCGAALVSVEDKSERVWNGAIGELLAGEADLIFASLTIDNERSQVVDFTSPYKPQGLSIVVKRVSRPQQLQQQEFSHNYSALQ